MRNLIIGSSGGIGSAVVEHLRAHGQDVVTASRSEDGVDIRSEAAIKAWSDSLDGSFERILIVTGALSLEGATPEKTIRALDGDVMAAQFATNAIGPALLIKHLHRFLPAEGPCVLAALSARVGSIGDNQLGGWISYRAAKAALNQIVHSAAIEINRKRKEAIVVAYHPGTIRTNLTAKYVGAHPAVSPAEAAVNMIRVLDGLSPADSGGFFDWKGEAVQW